MAERLFSPSWYRVAPLQPRLRRHAQVHRHLYRGQRWYVLQDHASQRVHRFAPAAYYLIGLMDGQRTVQEMWELASAHLGDDAPTQDEVIQFLTQLHAADVLQCDVPPDTTELLLRYDRQQRQTWQSQLLSPLFWRFPVCDPECFLRWAQPLVRPLFGVPGALLWLLVVGTGLILAAIHWHDLSKDMLDRVLAPQNLLVLWLIFPVVKTLHEFGHAFATKVYGGEVHEMGVMLLVLTPFPYVDASAASAFSATWQRLVVGAAGMLVELFLAALALFVWLNVEPGTVRLIAYNVMFIAGISTVLFNGNPLLRYDGYYILADALEIPNLRARAQAYVTYLCERYLFGRRDAESEAATPAERAWFIGFTLASCVYRLFVYAAISLFVASKFFFIGVVLALGGLAAIVVTPIGKLLNYLSRNPRLRRVRLRAGVVTASLVALLVGVTCLLPVPLRSRAEGVIWVPERALVRAGTEGFVEHLMVLPGTAVQRGEALILCRDPALEARLKVLEARLQEVQMRYTMQWIEDRSKGDLIKEEMLLLEEQLARARERAAELTIRSRTAGTFVVPQPQDLPGQFVKQGTQMGYVLDFSTLTARVVVSQDTIDLVRQRTRGVDVRLAERRAVSLPAVLRREVPGATDQLPSMALGSQGGGEVAIDPSDKQAMKAIQKLFQFDLELPASAGIINVGGRVYVRFDHGWEPLVYRWYRQIRRLFLARFYV
jgi:putative peptide zinc metalloprotease protein